MDWQIKSFDELTNQELYRIIQLRIDVFVVEQNCCYSDLDDLDMHPETLHLFSNQKNDISCYLRILAPSTSYPNMCSFGRVITNSKFRGTGIGHKLIKQTNKIVDDLWPTKRCHISAQAHLQAFYEKHQYVVVGDGYLEDGIPHVGMERAALVR